MPIINRFKSLFRPVPQRKPLLSVIEYDVNPHDFWDVIGELGDGAFGKVEKVCLKTDPKRLAAAKRIEIEEGENVEDFLVEIEILSQCKHQNIVGLITCYFFEGNLSLMLEYCEEGAVDSIMIDLEKALTEPQIAYITKNVCLALEFLHCRHIIHRDLKTGNILLTSNATVKLADFGVSAIVKNNDRKTNTFIGTPYWMAPEVMLCETIKDQPYNCLADIWSLGITLIEMAQMDPPNNQVSPLRVIIKIQKSDPPTLDRPDKWSRQFNDLIAKCLVKNPNDRCSASELITHPFVKNARDRAPIVQLLHEKNAKQQEEAARILDLYLENASFYTAVEVPLAKTPPDSRKEKSRRLSSPKDMSKKLRDEIPTIRQTRFQKLLCGTMLDSPPLLREESLKRLYLKAEESKRSWSVIVFGFVK